MLQNKALLVYFSASIWTGRKLDLNATRKVQEDFNAGRNSGNFTKYLISQEAIKEYSKIVQDFRNWLFNFTLPWDNCKGRLLSVKKFQEFQDKFEATKQEFDRAINQFCENYPDLINVAEKTGELGDLFNSQDYPPTWQIRDKFKFSIQYMPIQDINDFRISIQNEDLEKIKAETEKVYNEQMQENTAALWEKTRETVKHLLDKLQEPAERENGRKSSMKSSTLEKVQALSDFIDSYNFTGDKNLDSIAKMLQDLSDFNIDSIRNNPEEKTELAQKTNEILNKINQYI